MSVLEVERWGRLPYGVAHARMKELVEARFRGEVENTLILCEHDPVFTLGRRRAAAQNVFDAGDIPVVQVERGGDVTYHGPGQVVGYPILLLPEGQRDLHAVLRTLEEGLILALGSLGLAAGRDERNTGVWVGGKKIAAIGIACRRWVVWHGFALNVSIDLAPYDRIAPCGMPSEWVTRVRDWRDPCPSAEAVEDAVIAAMQSVAQRFDGR